MKSEAELGTQALSLQEKATQILVRDDASFSIAADFLAGIAALKKEIKAVFDPIVEAAHKAHKAASDRRKATLEPVEAAEAVVKRSLSTYQLEQEKARREIEEAERARIAAEKKVIEAIASAQAEKGHFTEATATIRQEFDLKANVPVATPKQEGLSFRDNWTFEITGPVPLEYTIPDKVKIGGVVKAMKDSTSIPGVRVWCEKVAISRGGQ